MAGPGMAPKARRADPSADRKRQAEFRHLEADGQWRGPELPDGVLPSGEDWHPRTRAWWRTWRESAQATTFTTTDWDFLLDTALMHHTMWTKGRWEFAGEIRLRAAKFGATPEDRMRLKLKVDTPGEESDQAPEPSDVDAETVKRRKGMRIVG